MYLEFTREQGKRTSKIKMVQRQMRCLRNIYHHSYTFSFLLVFLVLVLRSAFVTSVNTLSSTESLTLLSNRTLVSSDDVFELGFFNVSSSRWYLGMWFKQVDERAYVWVANTNNPLNDSIGILRISAANLVLLDHAETIVWSTNRTGGTRSPMVAELLDNGNFVLRESTNKNGQNGFLWQSFDFPTDTLLPQMKLGLDLKRGLNKFLTSWESPSDPSSGNFLYKLEIQEFPEFYVYFKEQPNHRSGPWDGIRFIGIPDNQQLNYMVYNFTENKEEVAYMFSMTNNSIHSRLTLSPTGRLERFTWIPTSSYWNMVWSSPKDVCDTYDRCGPYSYCDVSTSPICNCIIGFKPSDQEQWDLGEWAGGCERKTNLTCREDGFLPLKNMKLPDTKEAIVHRRISLKECEERCLRDCNCTAFANLDSRNGGLDCLIWIGLFFDIRNYAVDGHDLYIRLAASELPLLSDNKSIRTRKIIGLIVGISVFLLLLGCIVFCIWKRKRKPATETTTPNVNQKRDQYVLMNQMVILSDLNFSREDITEDLELPSTDYQLVVKATDNFSDSNKLGEGGFGSVYKGRSLSGEEIAVKRLSEFSHQGNDEFRVEVKVISRLQHNNLVRILGCCTYKMEKILIYEYLENSSLDRLIFDKPHGSELNWQKRFDIINGIVRGIVYLHHDSRYRVIHRDLKASNILLDKNMVPKISDFGMARIFSKEDEHEAITRRLVGTYGYMSPEYAMHGIYSEKSDVYSFGVLLLEIVTGKKNRGFSKSDIDRSLLGYVWRNMKEGTELEVADPNIVDSSSPSPTFQPEEFLRCLKIALLCVQEYAIDRPFMFSVASMLGNKTEEVPKANAPGYCVGRFYDTSTSSASSPLSTLSSWPSSSSSSEDPDTLEITMTDTESR